MTESEKEAFISGIEFARDWNFDISKEDAELYEKLIKERAEREEKHE